MRRPIQQPTITQDGDTEIQEHPAYAQIESSRITGGAYLYGSDFHHGHFTAIRIKRSQLNRDLARDWYFGKEEYIEVFLSSAQWASFVAGTGCSGVPCTLNHLMGERVAELPAPQDRTEQFSKESAHYMENALKALQELQEAINATSLSQKAKKSLLSKASAAARNISGNSRFVAESFDRHMEKTVERAKVEVNAYATATISRLGMQKLAELNDEAPLTLELSD